MLETSNISAVARQNMVSSQVRTNKVWDMAIVAAMESIQRESFVPQSYRAIAYIDEDIALANGRIVMEPMVAARMIQALELTPDTVAMEIATGMGFASAVMSRLCKTVIAVDSSQKTVESTQARLLTHGCDNVVVVEDSVVTGAGAPASVDAIFVNGGIERAPNELMALLSEGGKLVAPTVDSNGRHQVKLFVRFGESISSRTLFDANVPPLPEFKVRQGFAF